MTRPLGEIQLNVIDSLKRHKGYWYSGCGWLWNTPSGTTKLMESLHRRGIVKKEQYEVVPKSFVTKYTLIES